MQAALETHDVVKVVAGSGGSDSSSAAVIGSKSLRESYSGGAQQATSAGEHSSNGHLVGMVILLATGACPELGACHESGTLFALVEEKV